MKNLIKSALAGLAILSTLGMTATPVFAATSVYTPTTIPDGTVIFGDGNAYNTNHANILANLSIIQKEVMNNNHIWVKNFVDSGTIGNTGAIIDYNTGETVPISVLPAIVQYVNAVTVPVASRVFSNPDEVHSTEGGSNIVRLTGEDTYGNPLPNCTIYLIPNIQGLWITQVNGNTITSDVNMGTTSSPSMQTVNTPVPLFSVANAPAYDSVSITGLSADHLQTIPSIALTTGDDGTVSITLVDGLVVYVANSSSPTATNGYAVDPGTGITAKYLTFYSDLAGTQKIGTTILYWTGR
ncbi:MAG: hypothetical protein P4L49_19635 [Desulfosporosinus sp.]|nr:hypothetical protein [Desulfosporosinus sp.]